jgi:VanZ family protein
VPVVSRFRPGAQAVLWSWLPVVLWAGLIFAFSAQPNLRFVSQEGLDFIVRKAGHMFVFGVLAVLIWRALTLGWRPSLPAMPLSWLLAAAYAASDEFHQSFTAGRHPSPVDVGIDSLGALVALLAVAAWLRFRSRRIV